jgi:drug/metabolite transporter (DMT)-like permease
VTGSELGFCLSSLACSTASQICMKSATSLSRLASFLAVLGAAVALQVTSVVLVVLALRTLQISQLIPFAAAAYVLVPIAALVLFNERLLPRFWVGALCIVSGIVLTLS